MSYSRWCRRPAPYHHGGALDNSFSWAEIEAAEAVQNVGAFLRRLGDKPDDLTNLRRACERYTEARPEEPVETVVHILRHGQAICGRSGFPSQWPLGHKWIAHDDEKVGEPGAVSCRGCLAAFIQDALASRLKMFVGKPYDADNTRAIREEAEDVLEDPDADGETIE